MSSIKESENLNKQGLFIAGNIRSGTTILWRALNTSPDVCMLYEPLLFENANVPDFTQWYRERIQSYNMGNHKGTYPPAPRIDGENSAFNSLKRMAEVYRYVGEKLVFQTSKNHKLNAFIPFHKKHFPDSHYFFIVRHPVETIWSIYQRWPDSEIGLGYQFWLWSLKVMLKAMVVFPNAYMIIFEKLTKQTPQTAADILGISLQMPHDMIRRKSRNTNLATMSLPEPIQAHAKAGELCTELHSALVESLSESTLTFKQPQERSKTITNLQSQLKHSLAVLESL